MKFWFDRWNNIENEIINSTTEKDIKSKQDNIAEKIYKDKYPIWYSLRNKIKR